ncbi:MAG: DUF58 domain-containing protein [Desulfobacteraceae bacterium]|jgi:uncharacterized protein (DUF58 family)
MIRRFLYLNFRVVHVIKSWIMKRFTKAGLLVLAGLVASAVVGLDTHQTLAYQAFTFLFALVLTSIACGILFRTRLTAQRKLPKFGTAEEPLSYRIVIKNRTQKGQLGLYLREELEAVYPSFEEFLAVREPGERKRNPFDRGVGYHRWLWLINRKQMARVSERAIPELPSGGEEELRVRLVPLRRGRLTLHGLQIARTDPFGLWKSYKNIPIPQTLLVLPKRYPLPSIPLPGTRKYQPGGVALASSVGDSEEFLSLRDYRPGDPLRRIHWKSWAKMGEPIVKEYQDEFFVRHALILDTFQEKDQSEILEEALSVAASFAYTIQTQESLLDLMFVGTEAYCFTSGRGIAHVDRILEILASVRACSDKPFSTLPALVMERASLLSGCICVLLSWDEERQELIHLLKALGLPVLVLVITDDEPPQALDPGPMKDDPENLRRLQVGKVMEGLARL